MSTKKPLHTPNEKKKRNRRSGKSDPEWISEPLISSMQKKVGNRAVSRIVHQGRLSGEMSLNDLAAGKLVHQIRAVQPAAVQREVDPLDDILHGGETPDELDAGASLGNDGTVTIEPVVQTTFPVAGATLAQAARALGRDEWGRCNWQADYSFETTGSRVTKVDITLRLNIRMPVWSGYDSASGAAKAEWDRMVSALQAHEDRHAEIARTWAPVFKQNMLNQTVRGMRAQYASTRTAVNTEQDTYDTTTNHGQNEGVTLDISIR